MIEEAHKLIIKPKPGKLLLFLESWNDNFTSILIESIIPGIPGILYRFSCL